MRRAVYLIATALTVAAVLAYPALVDRKGGKARQTQIPDNGLPAFVEFYSRSCEICRMMRPALHRLAREFEGRANFLFLDVDDPANSTLLEEFRVYDLPSIHVIGARGERIASFEGKVGVSTLRKHLKAAVNGKGGTSP
ncbi:MAG: thioredoxin domain-containing protein [bacterium]